MDARRKSDGAIVGLKKVAREDSSQEINIGRLFSSGVLVGDRRNHCVPVLEVLESPELSGMSIVVMPLLRLYNDPSLQTVGEAVEFFSQLIEVRIEVTLSYAKKNPDITIFRACNLCTSVALLICRSSISPPEPCRFAEI